MSIQDGTQLASNFNSAMYNIMHSSNITISTIYSMHQAMSADVDVSSLDSARNSVNQLTQAMVRLNSTMDYTSTIRIEPPVPVEEPNGGSDQDISDNADEQSRFNQLLREGANEAGNLLSSIGDIAKEYMNLENVKKVLDISDQMSQTTARLGMMDAAFQETGTGFGSTDGLMDAVYKSAQNSRGSFGDMAEIVASFGNNGGDVFGSSAEVVGFTNLLQKQMVIAGVSNPESSEAMLQLSQSFGSGELGGDELGSIFEQAPELMQNIADYMGLPLSAVREMASEGQISAGILKSAVFAASDEINSKFEQMPMTWEQVMQSLQNTALISFQPVLEKINELINSEGFQHFANSAMIAIGMVAQVIMGIFDVIGMVGTVLAENWSWISPIIYGVVAALALYVIYQGISAAAMAIVTAAQWAWNAAMSASPITWIIILIIAFIALIFAVCNAIAQMTGIANSGFGVITGGINVVIQFFKNLGLSVANIALGIGCAIVALANNIKAAFHNAICSAQSMFWRLLSTALTVIAGICENLNKLPFVEIEYSGLTSAAAEYAAKAREAEGNKKEYTNIADAFHKGASTFNTFEDGWAEDAFNAGASWGDNIASKVSDFFNNGSGSDIGNYPQEGKDYGFAGGGVEDGGGLGGGLGGGIAEGIDGSNTAGNVEDINNSVSVGEEDLKYLRDLAEQEIVNRYTVAEISIDQTNNNKISSKMDLDGVVTGLTNAVNEAVGVITEGVHG